MSHSMELWGGSGVAQALLPGLWEEITTHEIHLLPETDKEKGDSPIL